MHVNDILVSGNNSDTFQTIIQRLHNQLALTILGSINYFLGFKVNRSSKGLILSQKKYLEDLLVKANMATSKPCSTSISTSVKLSLYDRAPFDNASL